MFTVVFSRNENDVREVLNDYKQYEDPIKAFRENQRILKVNIDSLLNCHLFCYIYINMQMQEILNPYEILNLSFILKSKLPLRNKLLLFKKNVDQLGT